MTMTREELELMSGAPIKDDLNKVAALARYALLLLDVCEAAEKWRTSVGFRNSQPIFDALDRLHAAKGEQQ